MSNARPSILIADDTPANLELLGYLLGVEYQTFFASTGREAVELALAHTPDLILMDVLMPGMDGFEACRLLKADVRTAEIPVIFVTAVEQEAEETRGLELGAIDFISKPFSPRMVQVRIRNHMKMKQQRDLLGRLCFQDGLTGIANRRRFDQVPDHAGRGLLQGLQRYARPPAGRRLHPAGRPGHGRPLPAPRRPGGQVRRG
jgi:PleD family two-component response regulator